MHSTLEPTFTEQGYPSKQTLETIAHWYTTEVGTHELLEYIRKAWKYPELVTEQDGLWMFSTGGWSGNEDLLSAIPCWGLVHPIATFAGGHYVIVTTKTASEKFEKAREVFYSILKPRTSIVQECQ